MARPKKENPLESAVRVRFTEIDAGRLRSLADEKGVTVANLIREKMLGLETMTHRKPLPIRKMPQRPRRTADPDLLRALAKIGNNVNQLARAVNQSDQLNQGAAVELLADLQAISAELDRLAKN